MEDSVSQDGSAVKIRSKAPGTAYITLTGTDPENEGPVNRAVMKVVVKATAPVLDFTGDALGLLEINGDETTGLTLKQGSCDRLFYSIRSRNCHGEDHHEGKRRSHREKRSYLRKERIKERQARKGGAEVRKEQDRTAGYGGMTPGPVPGSGLFV